MTYQILQPPQVAFLDPSISQAAAGGYVFFYVDDGGTTINPTFALSGTTPNYTYIPYPSNPDGSIPLNAAGAFNQQLYVYPFDGSGNIQKYAIEAYNASGQLVYQTKNFPTVSPDDGQLAYFIGSAGISPVDLSDQTQTAKAVANYNVSNDFYLLTGTSSAYVMGQPVLGVSPTSLVNGASFKVQFPVTNSANTTISFLGVTLPLKFALTNTNLPANFILGTDSNYMPTYTIQYSSAQNCFNIIDVPNIAQSMVTQNDSTPNYLDSKLVAGDGVLLGVQGASGTNQTILISSPTPSIAVNSTDYPATTYTNEPIFTNLSYTVKLPSSIVVMEFFGDNASVTGGNIIPAIASFNVAVSINGGATINYQSNQAANPNETAPFDAHIKVSLGALAQGATIGINVTFGVSAPGTGTPNNNAVGGQITLQLSEFVNALA